MSNLTLKKILLNPLFWIGIVLSYLTIYYEGQKNAYEIFFNPITYRNLFIGMGLYVAIFDVKYTQNREKIDILETLASCVEKTAIVLFIWIFSLSLYVGFHESGEMYSITLKHKLSQIVSK